MNIDDINATSFIDARSHEIHILEKSIQETRKKTLLFQRLPFHKRRRTRSKHLNKRRFSRRINHKQREKFIYYHKRFKMINFLNYNVPLQRREKSDSFIYKSEHRGYVFVEIYKTAFLYRENGFNDVTCRLSKEIKDSVSNVLIVIEYENEEYEIYKYDSFVIIIAIKQPRVLNYGIVEDLGISISVMKGKIDFKCNVKEILIDLWNKKENEEKDKIGLNNNLTKTSNNIYEENEIPSINVREGVLYNKNDTVVDFGNIIVLQKTDSIEKCKIIVNKNKVRELHDLFIKNSIIPICIFELFRIGLENNTLIYPFDYPNSPHYQQFERAAYLEEYTKWTRTPVGKRVNYEKHNVLEPWFIPLDFYKNQKLYISYFDVSKGSLKRMALIYKNEIFVGYVLRASYCYRIGKCRGVCVLLYKITGCLKVKNTNSIDLVEITII